MRNIHKLAILPAVIGLVLFCILPALAAGTAENSSRVLFAHCGKCGMGGEKAAAEMKDQGAMHDCENCSKHGMKQHDCASCAKQGHMHGDAKLKCAECEKAGHQHGHQHGVEQKSDEKLGELFEKS